MTMVKEYRDALRACFFAPHNQGGYHPGECEALCKMYPELGGYASEARVLRCVALYGDRRCSDGATAAQRKDTAREHHDRLSQKYAGKDYAYTGRVCRGYGRPDYPAVGVGQ